MMDTNPGQLVQRKALFCYQPNWSAYHEVQRTVRQTWQGHISGVPMFQFTRKLRSIKRDLKSWSRVKCTHFRTQIEKNTTQLQIVESKIIMAVSYTHLTLPTNREV